MATFVHITAERHVNAIRRAGIRAGKTRSEVLSGVYALPVSPNFVVSHQWMRELKRAGGRTYWAVYFRIPNSRVVFVGHFNREHRQLTAGEAAALFFRGDVELGYEVIIPGSVDPAEIRRMRPLPNVLGWRYFPGAHERRPCPCPLCLLRGEFGGRKLRDRLEAEESELGWRGPTPLAGDKGPR